MENTFLFVTGDFEFQESTPKGAIVDCTMLELEKPSQQGTMYAFEEGDTIAKTLVGSPIYYGLNWMGKHKKDANPIGKVLETWKIGKKIKGKILVTSKNLVDLIKRGVKFLFSVGGKAMFTETVKVAGGWVTKMVGAICNHLQMVPMGTKVGFPNAKMDKIVEINETVMFAFEETVESLIYDQIINSIGEIIVRRYLNGQ